MVTCVRRRRFNSWRVCVPEMVVMSALSASNPGTARAARIAYVVRIVVVAALAIAILRFVWTYKTVRVPEWNDQMEPTLAPGDKVLLHRGIAAAEQFDRGEMVVYAVKGAEGVSVRFGRVAALPGDKVELTDVPGREVLVNGEPLAYAAELTSPIVPQPKDQKGSRRERGIDAVPEGALYLVNDNLRSTLADSRRLGPIVDDAFAGKVVMTLGR
jgi:signal peptidase I